jgi:type VI secretion system protein
MILTNNTVHQQATTPIRIGGLLLAGLLSVLLPGLSGCNSIDKAMSVVVPFYTYDKTGLSTISVESSVDSNMNMPVAIDFVFIRNDEVAKTLMNLSGPNWFSSKTDLLLRYQKDLVLAHIEVVPLTIKQTITLPKAYDDAKKVLMFANFIAKPGQYLADISQFDEVLITLSKTGYQLKELNP